MAIMTKRIAPLMFFIAALGTSSTVFAHAHLTSHYPAADAQVSTVPQVIMLDFSEGIEANFSGVTLTGPEQAAVKTGKAQRNAQDKKQLIVPIDATLQPGVYQVAWHVVSVDGHKTKGHYQFTVK